MENQEVKSIYHYHISSTNNNSSKYGNCQICGKPVSEVFIQSEQKEYINLEGEKGLTYYKCAPHFFGHEHCLKSVRR